MRGEKKKKEEEMRGNKETQNTGVRRGMEGRNKKKRQREDVCFGGRDLTPLW